ncbi:dTMP kinase [Ottowia testudinis]|uniref:Thymidylate kinase n=1 Tax=Ottowia testudinis TaxID=2816950 RepID=A0A975CJZ4_9BURK|nr:dTMP kinase [Ottowia testudinis]QTD47157.1 dTMP kinase [Ottowia testudinis]
MAEQGVFISFEGIDGAGKSSHVGALADAFRAAGRTVLQTREPGGTPLAEQIRALVLKEPMGALTEALLMFAARRDHIEQVIAPALARGDVVLCDRFTDATFAYQGGGRGFDWQSLSILELLAQSQQAPEANLTHNALLQPDLTIWFDLPPSVAAARLASARVPDKFEAQPAAFFEAVRAGYARRAAESPVRFARVNADQPREAVWADVRHAAQGRGWL